MIVLIIPVIDVFYFSIFSSSETGRSRREGRERVGLSTEKSPKQVKPKQVDLLKLHMIQCTSTVLSIT